MIHHKSNEFTRKIDGDIHLGQVKLVTWIDNTRLHAFKDVGEGEIDLIILARDDSRLSIHMDQQTLREIHGIAEEFDPSLRSPEVDNTMDEMVDQWVEGGIFLDMTLADLQFEIADRWKRLDDA